MPKDEGRSMRMNPKQRLDHQRCLRILKAMGPERRLEKAFELSQFSRHLFTAGLRRRFPNLSDAEFHALLESRLAKCHNRNY